MSGRTYAADDREVISERLAASFKCTCLSAVAEDGTTEWKLTPDCPLHRVSTPAPESVTFLWSIRVYGSCPVGPDGIVHVGGCELKRLDGFTYTAPLPEYRAQIIARIRATLDSTRIPKLMSAAHFRVGR